MSTSRCSIRNCRRIDRSTSQRTIRTRLNGSPDDVASVGVGAFTGAPVHQPGDDSREHQPVQHQSSWRFDRGSTRRCSTSHVGDLDRALLIRRRCWQKGQLEPPVPVVVGDSASPAGEDVGSQPEPEPGNWKLGAGLVFVGASTEYHTSSPSAGSSTSRLRQTGRIIYHRWRTSPEHHPPSIGSFR
jgi:hypothetical protein